MRHFTDTLIDESLNYADQEMKMDAWHRGSRGCNVASCSNDKLKMNYDICVKKGYTYEANQLKNEAKARGLSWAEYKFNAVDFLNKISPTDFNKNVIEYAVEHSKDPVYIYNSYKHNSKRDRIEIYFIYLFIALVLESKGCGQRLIDALVEDGVSKEDIQNTINKINKRQDIIDAIAKNINEIDFSKLTEETEENLEEKIEKHDTLNPLLFDEDKHLFPEVREKLLKIAEEFIAGVEEDDVKINLTDIKIVGSNCSYNYNPDSDLDLHLVAKTSDLDDPDKIYPVVYNLYKSAWNNKYEPTIHGIPVELYVETEESEQRPLTEVAAEVPFDSETKVGDKIRIIHLAGEDTSYDGKEGTIEHIDGIGQLHGTWGGLAVIPGVDEFEVIPDEISEALVDDGEPSEGESGDMTPKEVADKLGVEPEVIDDQVEKGIEVEHEHTDNDELAKRIALDHLTEFPDYYDRLEKMEKEGEEAFEEKEDLKEDSQKNKFLKESDLEERISKNPLVSNGMYSVLNDKWIKEPEVTVIPEVNQEEIDDALAPWLLRYNEIIKEPKVEDIDNFINELFKARQESITNEGEYNPMNHAFKSLRAAGQLDELRELRRQLKEKEMSLDEEWINEAPELLTNREMYAYKIKIAQLTHYQPIIQPNGLFHIYQVNEDDKNRVKTLLNRLDEVEYVNDFAGAFDFSHPDYMLGTLPKRKYTITGQIKK